MAERILIVDDDVDSLKLIGLMLKKHGYEIIVADAGQKGLDKAHSESPDLIILDVMMPDMSGLEVARRLRSHDRTKDTPIIMFTAKTMIDDKVKGFEAGADDYLTKPVHPAELASRVKALLIRKAAKTQTEIPAEVPQKGKAIGVMGAKGGVGTTTLAVNLTAVLLQSGEAVLLADFQLGNGSAGRMLGSSSDGMAQVLSSVTIDATTVKGQMLAHQSGLRGLLSSSKPAEAQLTVVPEKALAALDVLREMCDVVVVDLGNGLSTLNCQLLPQMDKLIFVIEANSVALEIARDHLQEIDSLVGANRIHIVVNNRSQAALSWHDVENALQREVKAIISAAPDLAHQALENRQPMAFLQPTAMVSGQYAKLAHEIK